MKFGEKVKELRTSKGWSQEELAKKIGTSKRTVIYYETGSSYPRYRTIYTQLAEVFEVDVNYLLTENEEFLTDVTKLYGRRGQAQAKDILELTANLFAGGTLSQDDELAFVTEIQQLYLDSKKRAKKFTPRKYRKTKSEADE